MQRQLTLQNNNVVVPAFAAGGLTQLAEINGLAGAATYTLNGNALVTTGGTGGAGTFDFTMTVNFGARTLGATFGNIAIAAGGNAVAGVTLTIPPTSYAGFAPGAIVFIQENTAANCGATVTCNAVAFMQNGATRAADVGRFQLTVTSGANTSNAGAVPPTTPPRP